MAGIVTGNYRIRKGLPSIWIVGDKTGGAAGTCAPGSDIAAFLQGHRTAEEAPDLLAAGRPSRAVPGSVDHGYFGEATGVARWTGSRKASA